MDIPKYRLSKLYLYTAAASLFILSGYYGHRFLKYYEESSVGSFNLFSFIVFVTSIVLLMLLLFKFKIQSKSLCIAAFFVLISASIVSYDFIVPAFCADCKSNIIVGKRLKEQGVISFLRNYHKPTLYKIKTSSELYEKFLNFDNKLRLNYKRHFNNIENESPDITLSDNRAGATAVKIMTGNYSPLWFCFVGLWDTFAGDGYFSQVIIPANLMSLLLMVSLYFFLGLFYGKEEYRSKLLILFVILMLPIFYQQSVQSTSVLMLTATVTWVFFFLLKNTENHINCNDMSAGLFYSIAVLCKFTALTLMLPIALFYLIRFKSRAISKLFVFLLSFAVIPVLLYAIFEYDMVLNILSGSIAEFTLVAGRVKETSIFSWLILHDPYNFGVPFILLMITHMFKVRNYQLKNEVLTSYMLISCFFMLFFILWRSWISRHWLGFIPLTIPLFVYIYNNCEEKNKMVLSTSIFLLASNVLILVHEGIIMAGYYVRRFHAIYWSY